MWYNVSMNIYEFTKAQVTSYPMTEIELYGTRQFNQYNLLNTISAYTDSHYTTSEYDDLGRRKPFRNIVNRILHKQRTAEDIDTKNVELSTTKPQHYAKSLLMTVANDKWMKVQRFAHTLNEMTEHRGRDGGVLVKWVTDHVEVVDLLTTITDPTDILSGVKIQTLRMNPAELIATKKERGWGTGDFKGSIEESIMNSQEKGDVKEDGMNPITDYIDVYVIEGVLPDTMFDEDASMFDYSEQMHVITLFTEEGEDDKDENQSGLTLYRTVKSKSPYKWLPYEKVSGRSLGRGMVEASMQAQISINESVINEKNTMDVAGKALFAQPAGNGLEGNNFIQDYVDGSIFDFNITAPQLVNATPSSLGYHKTIQDGWQQQANDQTSVHDANTGNMPASATFRGMALANQEANSIFELRREEMGIFLQEIYQDWIIPYLKKWVKKQDFLEMELSQDEMQKVVNDYAYNTAREKVDARYFAGDYNDVEPGTKFMQMAVDTEIEAQNIKDNLKVSKKNWLKSGDDYLDGIEFDLDIIVTDEQRIKQVYLSNQVDILNTYLANREAFASDPNAMKMYNQIQETLGLSPLDAIDAEVQPAQEVQTSQVQLEATNPTI